MDVYERLQEILDSHPSGAPKTAVFDEILRILFTPEEASIAIHMSFTPKPADKIAAAAGSRIENVAACLETMADKAVIFSREKDGKHLYGLVPTIPGLFEFPLMRGIKTETQKKLGKLWEQYHREGMGSSFAGQPTPLARVIPVRQAISDASRVHPYEEVARFIEQAGEIAVAECACRVSVQACKAPTDRCLIFDGPARFLIQRGYARRINREEALAILDCAEKEGLVHTSNNSADKAGFICNCCRCCCTILRGRTQLHEPHAFDSSNFMAQIDSDLCTACGSCLEDRCPMDAIKMQGDCAVIDPGRCIGCGLCVSVCPVEAIALQRRAEDCEVPATIQDMAMKILKDKGKLESFIKVMSS
jgi:Pyruvate/2-oxoacid:ferredoxin oxidoreductase delta subunit